MYRPNVSLEYLKRDLRANRSFRAFKSIKDSVRGVSYRPLGFLVSQIEKSDVDLVLDVGANLGQFAKDLMLSGYAKQIQSFEPVRSQFEFLRRSALGNKRWETHNFAFGDRNIEEKIFVSSNSGLSSSFLQMNHNHLDNFPSAKIAGSETVQLQTIHDYINASGVEPRTTLLKLDVQGFESRVLVGCRDQLQHFALCFLEVSLIPLYEDESTFFEVLDYLRANGQQLIDVRRGVQSKSGDLLQLDILTRRALTRD
jgi:FkbM family methyltransferase